MRLKIMAAGFGLLFAPFALGQPAAAQATRTWVSGVGDDVNPCSRTAPCKTFAGAISKTAAGGEINCIDPGGFGAVTITKAMSIICDHVSGGVLAGGNGILVNAGPSDVVFLSGLDFQGANPPTNGVRFIKGGALHIQNSSVRGFPTAISFEPAGSSKLSIDNVTIVGNRDGIKVAAAAGGGATVTVANSFIANNSGVGIDASGSASTVTVANSTISGNGTGLSAQAGGQLLSYKDNMVHGNGQDGAFTGQKNPQ